MAITDTSICFGATLYRPAGTEKGENWTFLNLPQEASDKLPTRSMVSVEGTINGLPFQTTLEPDGKGGHWLKVEQELRKAAGVNAGDHLTLVIAPMAQEPEPKVPEDLQSALSASPSAHAVWMDITAIARRDWIQWLTSGKKAETRGLRLDKAIDMLSKGKRRICCFDRSGKYSKSISCPVAEEES